MIKSEGDVVVRTSLILLDKSGFVNEFCSISATALWRSLKMEFLI